MAKKSKRMQAIAEKISVTKSYKFAEAIELLKEFAVKKFKEGVDVSIKLGVDARKSDQVVRGASVLPHGTGKTLRIAVLADGEDSELAKNAGADIVGSTDLIDAIKEGEINFDVLIATPAAMKLIGPVSQILGPKGLMPNPKVGTVSKDVAKAVGDVKKGQAMFRTDKAGIIHARVGSIEFTEAELKDNVKSVIAELSKLKPNGIKGNYYKKLTLSTTMGTGLTIEWSDVL